MYVGLLVKYPLFLSDSTKLEFSLQILEKWSSKKFHENPSSDSRCSMPTGGRIDMTKLITSSRNLANTPANQVWLLIFTTLPTSREALLYMKVRTGYLPPGPSNRSRIKVKIWSETEKYGQGQTEIHGGQSVILSICPPQLSHGPGRNRTQASARKLATNRLSHGRAFEGWNSF